MQNSLLALSYISFVGKCYIILHGVKDTRHIAVVILSIAAMDCKQYRLD